MQLVTGFCVKKGIGVYKSLKVFRWKKRLKINIFDYEIWVFSCLKMIYLKKDKNWLNVRQRVRWMAKWTKNLWIVTIQ